MAQENLSLETFQLLFALSVECAKSMGLDQWGCYQSQLSDEDATERKTLFYCLHVLDKVICCTSGTFPAIAKPYVHIDTIIVSPDDSVMILLLGRVRLAAIEETIYHEIYASRRPCRNERD